MANPSSPEVIDHLRTLFAAYHHTVDIDQRGRFYHPNCLQICRPQPSYAAQDAQTIIRFLHEANSNKMNFSSGADGEGFSFRAISEDEFEFATDDITAPAGFTTAELTEKAKREDWVGTRVDLWFPDGSEAGTMLVKVKYWWRKEGDEWVQVLHDIMYMGPPDGTEGQ